MRKSAYRNAWPVMALGACVLATVSGCGILNPSLVGTLAGSSVASLPLPSGSIVILAMNQTDQPAIVSVQIAKHNEASKVWNLGLAAFGDAFGWDHGALVQECDVESIQLLSVTTSFEGGEPIELPSDSPPLLVGVNLSCGNVVAITITGVGAQPSVVIY